jgi:hypothetical protein
MNICLVNHCTRLLKGVCEARSRCPPRDHGRRASEGEFESKVRSLNDLCQSQRSDNLRLQVKWDNSSSNELLLHVVSQIVPRSTTPVHAFTADNHLECAMCCGRTTAHSADTNRPSSLRLLTTFRKDCIKANASKKQTGASQLNASVGQLSLSIPLSHASHHGEKPIPQGRNTSPSLCSRDLTIFYGS